MCKINPVTLKTENVPCLTRCQSYWEVWFILVGGFIGSFDRTWVGSAMGNLVYKCWLVACSSQLNLTLKPASKGGGYHCSLLIGVSFGCWPTLSDSFGQNFRTSWQHWFVHFWLYGFNDSSWRKPCGRDGSLRWKSWPMLMMAFDWFFLSAHWRRLTDAPFTVEAGYLLPIGAPPSILFRCPVCSKPAHLGGALFRYKSRW